MRTGEKHCAALIVTDRCVLSLGRRSRAVSSSPSGGRLRYKNPSNQEIPECFEHLSTILSPNAAYSAKIRR